MNLPDDLSGLSDDVLRAEYQLRLDMWHEAGVDMERIAREWERRHAAELRAEQNFVSLLTGGRMT